MMVIIDSPEIKEHKILDNKDDEAVVRIHQLERTGQASWDPNDPCVGGNYDAMPEEPSISAIIKPSGIHVMYLASENIEGSMLFSPRGNKRPGPGVSLMEEAIILETLGKLATIG
jgi:hypothetical protein